MEIPYFYNISDFYCSMNSLRNLKINARHKIGSPIARKVQRIFSHRILWVFYWNNFKNLSELKDLFSWKSIAVVWNSPILESSDYGEKIDSQDVVVRFNRWVMDNSLDSKSTWKRTDFWTTWALDVLLSPEVKKHTWNISNQVRLIVPFPHEETPEIQKGINITLLETLSSYKKFLKYYTDKDLYTEAYKLIWKPPSSWFLIIFFLLQLDVKTQILLFGFSFSSHNRISWEHPETVHDFKREEDIVKAWIEEYPQLHLFN